MSKIPAAASPLIPANTSGYNRIDLIVIEIDPVNNVTAIKDVQGTPSSDPQKPFPNGYQLPLAYVAVGNNVSVINQNVITDARTQMAVPIAPQINSGTFVPYLKGSTTAGSFTYFNQAGQYTVIGDVCIAQLYLKINTVTTPAAGHIMLGGLPKIGKGNQTIIQISGRIAGADFVGVIGTDDSSIGNGLLYNKNGYGYPADASALTYVDGFCCTLVYKC